MAMLSKAQILSANDYKSEVVHVEEWGGDVCIKSMSGEALAALTELSIAKTKDGAPFATYRQALLVQVICDDQGNLLFDGPEGIADLGKKSAKVLGELFVVASRLNPIGEQATKELAKNSETPQEDSTTA